MVLVLLPVLLSPSLRVADCFVDARRTLLCKLLLSVIVLALVFSNPPKRLCDTRRLSVGLLAKHQKLRADLAEIVREV